MILNAHGWIRGYHAAVVIVITIPVGGTASADAGVRMDAASVNTGCCFAYGFSAGLPQIVVIVRTNVVVVEFAWPIDNVPIIEETSIARFVAVGAVAVVAVAVVTIDMARRGSVAPDVCSITIRVFFRSSSSPSSSSSSINA